MQDLEKISQQHPIVLFDGVCIYCNRWINWLMRWDKKQRFRLLTLQSATAQAAVTKAWPGPDPVPDSVLLYYKGQWYTESTAALHIARLLGFPVSVLGLGFVLPSFLRNSLYRWVAHNRYRWWGKKNSCRVPTAAEKIWFLEA